MILAALSPAGLVATMTVKGSTNTGVFLTDLDQVFCPALRAGQTVALDHLSVHKNEAVRARVEARGCRLWFLPADSPDFNPIEHAFAKLKQSLRKAKARTQEALEAAIATPWPPSPPRMHAVGSSIASSLCLFNHFENRYKSIVARGGPEPNLWGQPGGL